MCLPPQKLESEKKLLDFAGKSVDRFMNKLKPFSSVLVLGMFVQHWECSCTCISKTLCPVMNRQCSLLAEINVLDES